MNESSTVICAREARTVYIGRGVGWWRILGRDVILEVYGYGEFGVSRRMDVKRERWGR